MGSSSQSSSSRPLTADERAATYNRAMEYLMPYIPTADKYKGSQVIDPAALYNRNRGNQGDFSTSPRSISYRDMESRVFDGDRYLTESAPEARGLVDAGKFTAADHYKNWGYSQGRTPYYRTITNRD